MARHPLVEVIVRKFLESSNREEKFEKLIRKSPVFKRLTKELEKLEKELGDEIERVAKKNPEFKKGVDDYRNGGWKKYL